MKECDNSKIHINSKVKYI